MASTPPSSVCSFPGWLDNRLFHISSPSNKNIRPGIESQACCLNPVWVLGFSLPSGAWPAGHAWTWVNGIRLNTDLNPLSWIIYICRYVFITLFQSVLSLQGTDFLAFLLPCKSYLAGFELSNLSKLSGKYYFPHLHTEALSWLCSLIINSFAKLRSNLSFIFPALEFNLACDLYNPVLHITQKVAFL